MPAYALQSDEGSRQQGEISLGEFLSPPVQAHDDKEISIGKKRTPEFRHRDRIRHGGDNSYGNLGPRIDINDNGGMVGVRVGVCRAGWRRRRNHR
jgi:hypothetical protein